MKNEIRKLPVIVEGLLRLLSGPINTTPMLGDTAEEYTQIRSEKGSFAANFWCLRQILKPLPSFFINYFRWSMTMLRNYLKIVFRNIRKSKGFSFINIFGLSTGIACSILIYLYVHYELSYDNFHKDPGRIFRLGKIFKANGQDASNSVWLPPPVAPAVLRDYPEVEEAVRITFDNGFARYKDKTYAEKNVIVADAGFFNIFNFTLISGNPENALDEPYTAVLTKDLAERYFEEANPMGKTLIFNEISYKITGVLAQVPEKSHLQFDLILSLKSLAESRRKRQRRSLEEQWWYHAFITYIKTQDALPSQELIDGIYNISKTYAGDQEEQLGFEQRFAIEPILDVYLNSDYNSEGYTKSGNSTYIYLFISTAIFILALACINFANLTIARSVGRIKEVGLRMVVGAKRKQLAFQFLTDAIIIALISSILAVIIVKFALPYFRLLTGQQLYLKFIEPGSVILLLCFTLFTGVISGFYPAYYLSRLQPAESIKGKTIPQMKGKVFRKSMVVFQFAVSIILIISSALVSQQINFMKDSDLGFDREQIMVIPFEGSREPITKNRLLKNELTKNSSVLSASVSSTIPGRDITSRIIRPEGIPENENQTMNILFTDPDFLETFGLEIAAGRFFSDEVMTDSSDAFILNEEAVRKFGWGYPQNAIGKEFEYARWKKGRIIGVVKDYHFSSLHSKVIPIVTQIKNDELRYISLKLNVKDIQETISYIENTWKMVLPGIPVNYFFLDNDFNAQYNYEEKVSILFDVFTYIAIIIACLGLFGLASFLAEQRKKEIGIRKAIGATVQSIICDFSKVYVRWIILANVFAWPVAWILIEHWLQNFAYRIDVGLSTFILSGLAALLIALMTVTYQSIRSGIADPVNSLRYDS